MTVKTWFMMKNFDIDERIAIGGNEPVVVKETEKAYFLKWNTDFGIITHWVPKSCIEETPAISDEMKQKYIDWKTAQDEKEKTFVKGAKVKKIGGRKIFTITSEQITYGGVWLDNGKKVSIDELVLVS